MLKVEPPEGCAARRLPPFVPGQDGAAPRSLYWAAVGLGKRSVVLDLNQPAERARFRRRLRTADVLIESFDPGVMASWGLDYAAAAASNPRLVYVSVTPFGQDGPDALTPATELTLEAAGGLLALQGDGDRPPIPAGYPQAAFHAGVQAAADTLIALNAREQTGWGQHLDVSMQAAVVWALMNATGFPPNTGLDPPAAGENRAALRPMALGTSFPARTVWETNDGYVFAQFHSHHLGARSLQQLLRWAEEEGAVPELIRGRIWGDWMADLAAGALSEADLTAAFETVARLFREKTRREIMTRAVTDGIAVAPILDVPDLLHDPQLQSRNYWEPIEGVVYPGPFVRYSQTPLRLRRVAPSLGEAQPLLRASPRARPEPKAAQGGPAAFAGLRVADFAWVGVGPLITKALADHGATVVHVESTGHPDVLRLLAPFKDDVPGLDRSQFFANFNTSKLGLAVDFDTPEGLNLARRLIRWADVVAESFTPGTLDRRGLGYAAISSGRPDLVMLSTSLRGQTGPQRTYPGFGSQGAALSGIHGITGWPDRPPCGPWGAYTDFIAARYGVAAMAAALLHRERTGQGQHIDFAQVEAAIHFIEPLILDCAVNGRAPVRSGPLAARGCPSGVYQTAGVERYIALAVERPAQWQALREVAPLDAFSDPALDEESDRRRHRNAIDAALRRWTAGHDPWALVERLTAVGVPASVALRPSDLYAHRQLAHRGFFVTLEHREMGPTPYDGFATRFSGTPGRLRNAAPCLGQDTEYILRELLGLSEDEAAACAMAGALS